ncbi:mitochondrial inner membrane protein OXA1L-like [Lampetra fluviatilis]
MKNVFRIVPIVILPLVASFPTAVFTYWLTSNVVSLLQVSVLRVGAVRRKLGIPERVRHAAGAMPSQGFISTVKKNWSDSKEAHRLKERERFIKHRLDIAAKAPLRQTFSQNPLQQQQQQQKGAAPVPGLSVTSKRSEVTGGPAKGGPGGGPGGGSKPWGDSLG